MKVYGYSDEYCTQEVNTNIGVYNDLKVSDPSCCDLNNYPSHSYVVLNMFLIKLTSLYGIYSLNQYTIRLHSMYAKTVLYILPKTMMTQMLVLKWMTHFILITCTIPSYAVLPNITNRTVDGDVRRR